MKVKIKMKDRFLNAIIMGEIGVKDSTGFMVTLRIAMMGVRLSF